MTHAEHFLHFAADEQDCESGGGKLGEDPIDLGLGSNVDAACRLIQDENPRTRAQPLAQHDLLLVSPAQ